MLTNAKPCMSSADTSPAAHAGAPVTALPAPAPETTSRGRILHVDDDPLATRLMVAWLSQRGYTVTSATDASEADEILRTRDFDLIISDIHMPGNTRLEWTESLSARPRPIPVILITANPALETACRAANLQVAGYLIKPPDWTSLDAKLQTIIAHRRQRGDFVSLARQILRLVEQRGDNDSAQETLLLQRLASLASNLAQPAATPNEAPWRTALEDTLAVIERTKHSFRSRELGQLRQRLEHFLTQQAGS
jgi:CheY-like chemotaxis protein